MTHHTYVTKMRKVALATSLVLLSPLSLGFTSVVYAQTQTENAVKQFLIPAGPLGQSLNEFAQQAGIAISFDATMVRGKSSQELKISTTTELGLQRLLQGSGFTAVKSTSGYRLEEDNNSGPLILAPIKVQGELRDRPLLETHNSVAVETEATLIERNIITFEDVLNRTPGVTSLGDLVGGVSIRGMPVGGIQGTTFGDTITLEVDGVRQSSVSYNSNLFDTEQVEIFRGGQSTNRGAAAIAGAIDISTNDPGFEQEARIELITRYSEQHDSTGYMVNVMGNQPLNDNWAIRAVGTIEDFDGYVFNNFRDTYNDEQELNTGRVKLRYRNDSGSIDAVTTFNYSDSSRGFSGLPDIEDPDPSERIRNSDVVEFRDNKVISIAQQIDWKIDEHYSLTSTISHLQSDGEGLIDRDASPVTGNFLLSGTESKFSTVEVKLSYEDDTQNYLLGLYTQKQEGDSTLDFNQFFNLFDGAIQADLTINTTNDNERTNAAIFGEYERQLSDKFSIRAGLRYDYEEQEVGSDGDAFFTPAEPATTLLGAFLAGQSDPQFDSTDYSALLPSLSVTYEIDPEQTLTLLLKEDYRAGGVTLDVSGTSQFDPETTNTIELAYRKESDNLSIQSNVYYTKWKDMQVGRSFNIGGIDFFVIDNAGEATQYGVELSVNYQFNNGILTYAAIAYNNTNFDDYVVDDTTDYTGNEFPFAPPWNANAGVTWFINDKLSWDTNLNYEDDRFRDSGNGENRVANSYVVVNTNVRYAHHDWYASFYINNITDEEYIPAFSSNDLGRNEPRTFGITVGYNF